MTFPFLEAFLNENSSTEAIENLQSRLEHMHLIVVEYPAVERALPSRHLFTDQRIWRTETNKVPCTSKICKVY